MHIATHDLPPMTRATQLVRRLLGLGMRPSLEEAFERIEEKADELARYAGEQADEEERQVKRGRH